MRFCVEYVLMEHEFSRSVCGISKVTRLSIIKADIIRFVKGEISMRMRVRPASSIIDQRWGCFLQGRAIEGLGALPSRQSAPVSDRVR